MYPVLKIANISFFSFGLALGSGLLLALAVLFFQAKKFNLPFEKLHTLTLCSCVGGVIGSRIAYLIQHGKSLSVDNMIRLFDGGMSYGIIIGLG